MKDSRKTIKKNLKEVLNMLGQGQFIEAQEKFLHNDVQLIEGNSEPKQGKELCIRLEKEVLSGVKEFIGYTVNHSAVSKGVSFYEGTMEYVETSGNRVKVEQSVVTQWEDGQIVMERYYHA
jgi:hypothetical protein